MEGTKIIKSQEELDALGNYSGTIIISFGTVDNHAILDNTSIKSIEIQNDSVVDINNVNPDSLISIKDDSVVYIYAESNYVNCTGYSKTAVYKKCRVKATDFSSVISISDSNIFSFKRSTIHAFKNTRILAHDESKIYAHDKTYGIGEHRSTFFAYDESIIFLENYSKCIAFGKCEITTRNESFAMLHDDCIGYSDDVSEIIAYDNSDILASNHSTATVFSTVTISAVGEAIVYAHDKSNVRTMNEKNVYTFSDNVSLSKINYNPDATGDNQRLRKFYCLN